MSRMMIVQCDKCNSTETKYQAMADASEDGWEVASRIGYKDNMDICPKCADDLGWF